MKLGDKSSLFTMFQLKKKKKNPHQVRTVESFPKLWLCRTAPAATLRVPAAWTDLYLMVTGVQHDWQRPSMQFSPARLPARPAACPPSPSVSSVMQLTPLQITPQLYTSAACQHLPGALTRPARNEKLSLLASTQQVRGPLGQLLGNATDLVVGGVKQTLRSVLKGGLLLPECCW